MTIGRTTAGINKAEDAGTAHGQISSTNALQRVFPTTVSSYLPISWLDLTGDFVRPNFGNISE